jgi:hypothetical protein
MTKAAQPGVFVKYAYDELSPKQFEELVVLICQRLLGMSVQGFAEGPDGGRDARFDGTANLIPSQASPWVGKVIIQAKHTNGLNCTFSDKDFFSDKSETCVIAEEIPRIVELKKSGELDFYILFSNRRLPAQADADIRKAISNAAGIPTGSILLLGTEEIERYLKQFPEITDIADIDPIDSPLIVSPDALAEVVQALAAHKGDLADAIEQVPEPRFPYDKKNELNGMTPEYATVQRRRYLKEAKAISDFLGNQQNADIRAHYDAVVEEFELKIISKRKHYQDFDSVMEYLATLLFARDPILRQRGHQRLTRAVLFFMYWSCDIGLKDDAETL